METPQQQSFLPSEINQHEFTTLNEINQIQLESGSDDGSEQGQMSTSNLSLLKPLYKQINPSTSDSFYIKFFNCLQNLQGPEISRYGMMKDRFRKFFIYKQGLGKGQRWNKRLEPDYTDPSTYPLSNAVMIYGVDYLSNRDIRNKFNLPKSYPGVKRINWSNVVIMFQSRQQLEEKLKPLIFDKQEVPFFRAKQQDQQQEQQQLLTFQQHSILNFNSKLPRQWYGLRPYQYKDEYIFWFVRYLTNIQPQFLHKIKQTTQFMQTYNASKKLWERKEKTKQNFDSSIMNTSRYETIYRSRGSRSINGGSEPEKRERSRQKLTGQKMDIESQDLMKSNVLENLYQQSQQILLSQQENPLVDQSHHEQMSFVYTPQQAMISQQQSQLELKKKSDQILGMFEMMTVNCGGKTLENVRNMGINEEDEEDDEGMEVITQTFDPKGLKDCLFFERKNKISKLTELKPEVKFNYSDYVEKIIEAEEENKDKNKKAIPVICLD